MPIYQNIDGVWKLTTSSPKVHASGGWKEAETIHVHAQGAWRKVWPVPEEPQTGAMLTVDAVGATYPNNGTVTVSIRQIVLSRLVRAEDIPGIVIVTSGSWTKAFDASQGSVTFQLPARNSGSYTVTAVWSEDQTVRGQDTYSISKANASIYLEPGQQTIQKGQSCYLTTRIRYVNGEMAPAGGVTEIARQAHTNGPMGGFYDARSYTGADVTRTVTPDQSIVWHTRLRNHPNLNDAVVGATTWVQNKISGHYDLAGHGARSYNGNGSRRQDNYPVYHGYYGTNHGKQHGFIWFPPLASNLTCTSVDVLWYPQWCYNHGANAARMAVGYHTLPNIPSSVNYGDSRIWRGPHHITMSQGRELWINLPHMPGYVNGYRGGGFGMVVGHDSTSQAFYGYGYPTAIRYHWEGYT